MPRASFEFRGESEVSGTVCGVHARCELKRNCRHTTGIDAEVVLGHALDLKFDVWPHPETHADNANAGQIALQTGDCVPGPLHEIDPCLDAYCSGSNDVHVFSDQRSLLSVGSNTERQQDKDKEEATHVRFGF